MAGAVFGLARLPAEKLAVIERGNAVRLMPRLHAVYPTPADSVP